MFPWIQLGPFVLWSYGLMLGVGFVLCFLVSGADFRRRGVNIPIGVLGPCMAVCAMAGARLDYALVTQWHVLHQNPFALSWPGILAGGYTGFGGVLACIPCCWLQARIYGVPVLKVADVAPVALIVVACGRMGCFLAGDGDYGIPTSLPWGVSFPHGVVPTPLRVHPTCLYELIGALIVFAILWPMGSPERYKTLPHGTLAAGTFLGMGFIRFPIEFLSRNPRIYAHLTEAQWASIGFILGAGALSVILYRSRDRTPADGESARLKADAILSSHN